MRISPNCTSSLVLLTLDVSNVVFACFCFCWSASCCWIVDVGCCESGFTGGCVVEPDCDGSWLPGGVPVEPGDCAYTIGASKSAEMKSDRSVLMNVSCPKA